MFSDTNEWIKAVRNSSMDSLRQERLIKEIREYERTGVWSDQLCRREDKINQSENSGTKSKGGMG